MSRIRSIKPEWTSDGKLQGAGDSARVLSAALITLADDHGRGAADLGRIAGVVWARELVADPGSTIAKASRSLLTLARIGYVTLYEINGERYFELANWARHQRIEHPSRSSRIPNKTDELAVVIKVPDHDPHEDLMKLSREIREVLGNDSPDPHETFREDLGSRILDLGSRIGDLGSRISDPDPPSVPLVRSPPHNMHVFSEEKRVSRVPDHELQEIFGSWRERFGKTEAAKLSERRKRAITARRKRFTVAELVEAIRGAAANPWRHAEPVRHELATLLKSDEAVENFLEEARSAPIDAAARPEPAREPCQQGSNVATYQAPPHLALGAGLGDPEDPVDAYGFDDDGDAFEESAP